MKKEEKKLWQKILSIVGLGICIFMLPILVINVIIIVESRLYPEKVPGVLGLTPMIVVTDSMSPVISGGDMIMTRKAPAEELAVGDVISFFDPSFSTRVVTTHRIVEITPAADGTLLYTTRGDANTDNDPKPVASDQVVGRYIGKIPKLGQIALYMRTVPGLILFVLIPVVLFAGFEILAIRKEKQEGTRENLRLRQELEELRNVDARVESGMGAADPGR